MMPNHEPKLSYDLQRHLGRCVRLGADAVLEEPLSDRMADLLSRLDARERKRPTSETRPSDA